eukprot:10438389-Heterocapsa_arctica.AAC.1
MVGISGAHRYDGVEVRTARSSRARRRAERPVERADGRVMRWPMRRIRFAGVPCPTLGAWS